MDSEHSVEPRYLHKFLDSWIQVCDFKVAAFLFCCRPYTQQRAQTSAIDMLKLLKSSTIL